MTTAIALRTAAETSSSVAPAVFAPPARFDDSSRPQLERASLLLYNAKPGGSGEDLGPSRGELAFHFNPKEFTIAKAATWTSTPAKGAEKAGPPEFTGAGACKMTLEMFFDASASHDGSVVAAVEALFSCCVPTEESLASQKATPPLVVLKWGSIRGFPSYVTQVSAKYTLFAPDGTPIRATCSVSMDEMPGVTAKQNPTSGALDARRQHTVIAGDSLASVAYKAYGDPAMWRALAQYNRIDDPLRLPVGASLFVPGPDDLAALTAVAG